MSEDVAKLIAHANGGEHEAILRGDPTRRGVLDRWSVECICGARSESSRMTVEQARQWAERHKAGR